MGNRTFAGQTEPPWMGQPAQPAAPDWDGVLYGGEFGVNVLGQSTKASPLGVSVRFIRSDDNGFHYEITLADGTSFNDGIAIFVDGYGYMGVNIGAEIVPVACVWVEDPPPPKPPKPKPKPRGKSTPLTGTAASSRRPPPPPRPPRPPRRFGHWECPPGAPHPPEPPSGFFLTKGR